MTVGRKIRQFRQTKGWSLAELAKASSVALSTLSRIETGRMTGTLESHLRVAKALGVRLAELYAAVDPLGAPAELHRASDPHTRTLLQKQTTSRILIPSSLQKEMLPLEMVVPAQKSSSKEKAKEGTEKFVYVLKGKIRIEVGEEVFELNAGDTLYFQASLPHSFSNPGTAAATLLCVSSPPAL